MRLRVDSPLSDELEAIVTRVIGCAIEVHRNLGPGLAERIYEDAMTIELELQGLTFSRQQRVVIEYKGRKLRPQRLDLVVEQQIVVELKAVERLLELHKDQLLSYLHAADLPVGLLFNFNGETIKGSMKRVVNAKKVEETKQPEENSCPSWPSWPSCLLLRCC
jgi:GxxExxY protein